MDEKFKRENRYIVLKIKDLQKYVPQSELSELLDSLLAVQRTINVGRSFEGKLPFRAMVLEHDWPEYDKAWLSIELRTSAPAWKKEAVHKLEFEKFAERIGMDIRCLGGTYITKATQDCWEMWREFLYLPSADEKHGCHGGDSSTMKGCDHE